MMRRDHPEEDEDRPEAPSTGPLPRRAIPGGPAGGLKPKALFLDGVDSEGEEGELTFKKEKGKGGGRGERGVLEFGRFGLFFFFFFFFLFSYYFFFLSSGQCGFNYFRFFGRQRKAIDPGMCVWICVRAEYVVVI